MAHGQPDFGMYAAKEVVGSMADNAELAARLASINTYDRRGDVVYLDDFESPVISWEIGLGAGVVIIPDSTSVKSGSQALKLTLGAVPGGNALIRKWLHELGNLRVGAEIGFSVPQDTYAFEIHILYYDGTFVYTGRATVDFNAEELTVWDRTLGEKVVATGLKFYSLNHAYHVIKLVCDFKKEKFVRVLLNQSEYDISAYTVDRGGSGNEPMVCAYISLVDNGDGDVASIWIDDFILTENEP